jgi:predicted nucleotide-binding protein
MKVSLDEIEFLRKEINNRFERETGLPVQTLLKKQFFYHLSEFINNSPEIKNRPQTFWFNESFLKKFYTLKEETGINDYNVLNLYHFLKIDRNSALKKGFSPKQQNDEKALSENKLSKRIFLIHGQNEDRLLELEKLIAIDFGVESVILKDKPNSGAKTIIEKFELYAQSCDFAIALFSPDDIVNSKGKQYFQARPNTIFELGWFCGKLGRDKIMLLLQDGTEIFSDFQGIIQIRFKHKISEQFREIYKELKDAEIIK